MIPTFQDLLSEEDCREKAYYLFSIGERGYYLVDDLKVPEFGSYRLEGMQIFRELEPGYQALQVLQEARSTVGEKAGGSAAAVAQR